MANLDLWVINRGSVPTCLREQGNSIVDITLGSPEVVRLVMDWKVDDGTESLSDHKYIRFCPRKKMISHGDRALACFPRWNFKKIDKDIFNALYTRLWPAFREKDTINDDVKHLENTLTQACDLAMPRIKSVGNKKTIY